MEKSPVVEKLLQKAERKFGFRFAVELHHALATGSAESRSLLRQVLKA